MERGFSSAFLMTSSLAAATLLIACDEEQTESIRAEQDAGAEDAQLETGTDVAEEPPLDVVQEVGKDGSEESGSMRRTCAPFGPSITSPALSFGNSLVLADFNCDDRLDAMTNHYLASPGGLLGGRVDFHSGRGDGTFADPISIELPGGPTDLTVGDFDGDGVTDLVVDVISGIRSEHSALLLIRGQCGKWPSDAEVVFVPNPYRGTDRIVADLNADGADDLIVSRSTRRERIGVLFGGGAPFQGSSESEELPDGISQLASADLNGDGEQEIIAAGEKRWVILADGLTIVGVSDVDASGMVELAAMDLDNDGSDELVASRSADGWLLDAYRYVSGSGRFVRLPLMHPATLKQMAVDDITGDGRQDLAAVTSDATELLINGGDELLRASIPEADGTLAIGDVTGDGYKDLVYASREWLRVYPNQPLSCEHSLPRW